jgi:hypothetical protein
MKKDIKKRVFARQIARELSAEDLKKTNGADGPTGDESWTSCGQDQSYDDSDYHPYCGW